MEQATQLKEAELFFRQWLRSPKSMGSVTPSSKVLARALTEAVVWRPGQTVVELGAGTGPITQGLIDGGLPPDAIMTIELDRSLVDYLRARFPKVRVVHGDATRMDELVQEQGVEDVSTIISGLPMVNMPFEFQRAIIEPAFKILKGDGFMLQYSYAPFAPIRARRLGVRAELIRYVLRNLPPASVWRFRRAADAPGGA